MMIKKAQFEKSAADKTGWITDEVPEICFVGRSNVGKSSFINALTNQKKLAKTSSTPGKTRLLNFFIINDGEFRIVDAPGYGYAKINVQQKEKFGQMMEDYLLSRENLKGICLLLDLRHQPTKDDVGIYHFFKDNHLPVLIVGTKLDKLKRNEIAKNEQMIKKVLKFDSQDQFIKVSNLQKTNLEIVYNELKKLLERGH